MNKNFCIFDMDGTLTDSMHFWRDLGRDYLRSKGVEPEEKLLWMVRTMTMAEAARHFIDCFGLTGPPEAIVGEMNAIMAEHYRRDVPLKPGVKDYLEALRGRGARLCVATATAEPLARDCLARLGVAGRFAFIASCEDIGVSKDEPDLFLLAAERLGAAPEEIAVFEDAPYAVETAKRAGFYTVGVYEASYAPKWEAVRALAHETITDWREAL